MSQLLSALATPGGALTGLGALPRASYAAMQLATDNVTINTVHFYDSEFRQIQANLNAGIYGNVGNFDNDFNNGSLRYLTSIAASRVTAAAGGFIQSGTWAVGEFGSDAWIASERGVLMPADTRYGTNTALVSRNTQAFCDSDHSDRNKVLLLSGGTFVQTTKWRPHSTVLDTAADGINGRRVKPISVALPAGLMASMIGSASYNNVRKELVLMAYNPATAGQYDVYIWKNFDFDTTPISSLPNTPSNTFSINTNSIYPASGANFTTETQLNISPILCDNGNIFFTAMYPSAGHRLFRITRNSDDSVGTVTSPVQLGSSTAYGMEQGSGYGAKKVQSRDGRLVAVVAPYYYYQSGGNVFIVDKRSGNYTTWQSTDTNGGASVVKYRDDGIGVMANFASYSVSGSGKHVVTPYFGSSSAVVSGRSMTLAHEPNANSSTYPVATSLAHVWEYDFQPLAAY